MCVSLPDLQNRLNRTKLHMFDIGCLLVVWFGFHFGEPIYAIWFVVLAENQYNQTEYMLNVDIEFVGRCYSVVHI